MPERLRGAILGLGAVAQAVHLPLLDRLGDRFEIAAVADLSASLLERIGERYRVSPARRFTGFDALLAVDIVAAQRIVARHAAQIGLSVQIEAQA